MPAEADAVVMLEHTIPVDEFMVEVVKGVGVGANISQPGEDIREDEEALSAGHTMRPQDIGLLAGLGIQQIAVSSKVNVGILSTGDEIIPYNKKPDVGQIRNINAIALAGQVKQAGAVYRDYGIVSDQFDIFMAALQQAVDENDIVLFSGGSSVGMRDLGEQAVDALGPPGILVHGVTLKPGKPVLIGMSNRTPVFGLPGHPVSAMVCFDTFVKPAIDQISGKRMDKEMPVPSISARITRSINSAPGRLDVVRVTLARTEENWIAEPVLGKSGSISTLSRADGYFLIKEESQGVTENSVIEVHLFQ